MQVGGVGSNLNEHTHHVTNFSHFHATEDKQPMGSMPSQPLSGGSAGTPAGTSTIQQIRFSLAEWIADPLKNIRKFAGRIWYGGDQSGSAVNGTGDRALSGEEQILASIAEDMDADAMGGSSLNGSANHQAEQQVAQMQAQTLSHTTQLHTPQIVAAATAIQQQNIHNNPYFSALEDTGRQPQHIWQKMKVRFHSVTGFLTKRFSFSGQNSFQAKQGKPREDLRKRSRYHGEDLEVDCVLTDDSYLLDSYDRSGNYSQLSTKGSAAAKGITAEND